MAQKVTAEKQSRANLVITVGLAAVVASIFGTIDEVVKERHESRTQRCELAQRLIAQPPTDRLVDDAAKRHLLGSAYQRLDICLRSLQ